jgi:hypothetical protein
VSHNLTIGARNLQDGDGGEAGDAEGESLREELRRVWDASAEPVLSLSPFFSVSLSLSLSIFFSPPLSPPLSPSFSLSLTPSPSLSSHTHTLPSLSLSHTHTHTNLLEASGEEEAVAVCSEE